MRVSLSLPSATKNVRANHRRCLVRVDKFQLNVCIRQGDFLATEGRCGWPLARSQSNAKVVSDRFREYGIVSTRINKSYEVAGASWTMNGDPHLRPEDNHQFPCIRRCRDNRGVGESHALPTNGAWGILWRTGADSRVQRLVLGPRPCRRRGPRFPYGPDSRPAIGRPIQLAPTAIALETGR